MPLWNVSGADTNTGEEKVFRIEASTAASAEHKARAAGLLVAGVAPAEPLDAIAAASGGPHIPAYRSSRQPSGRAVPTYQAIVVASFILRISGGVAVAVAIVALSVIEIASTPASPPGSPYGRFRPSPSILGAAMVTTLLTAGLIFTIGVSLYAIAELCLAVRDIARNTFHHKT